MDLYGIIVIHFQLLSALCAIEGSCCFFSSILLVLCIELLETHSHVHGIPPNLKKFQCVGHESQHTTPWLYPNLKENNSNN